MESADFINYFSSLEGTGAVACYIEGFKNGRTFQLAADAAATRKVPIVAVKVGRTDEGKSMAKAHTGHLTGRTTSSPPPFANTGSSASTASTSCSRSRPPSPAPRRRRPKPPGA